MQDSYRSNIFIFIIMDNSHTIVISEKKGGEVDKRREREKRKSLEIRQVGRKGQGIGAGMWVGVGEGGEEEMGGGEGEVGRRACCL